MQDIQTMMAQLRRPGLLIRAARIAAEGYRREAHLAALLGASVLPRHGAAVMKLWEREAELDGLRRNRSSMYVPSAHVEVLSAMIAEAQLLQAQAQ
ncbi:DUF6477 family protein [Pseudooceanicola spongiae]|uniref:Uncharacterized protein n=1 Tax=Pseudooceanicola spongiae TaxID=2613965 RepID=A0A7L9WJ22_9RHOB|nr:DUF6477 family protein [Pseudooceanicola spongiae]QOL79952.1 hypothetical protein F3W81_03405 [Pseudooceanicola spongiae]